MLREDDRRKSLKKMEGLKIGGVVNLGIGIGLTALLFNLAGSGPDSPYLVGVIPAIIGAGLLVYVYFLAPPME